MTRTLLISLSLLPLGACSLHDVNPAPEPDLGAPIPERFRHADGDSSGEAAMQARWWELFQDDGINRYVELALDGSLDLKRAYARVQQAESLSKVAGAAQLPTLNANAQAGGARNVFNLGDLGLRSIEAANFQFGVSAAYEVDLWGRVSASARAAEAELEATREDIDALEIGLAARVVDACLGIASERELLTLLDAQEESNARLVELVELRFTQGLATAVEVYQQRQLLSSLRSQRPLAESRAAVLENQLAVLVGRPPGGIERPQLVRLPPNPPLPAIGVPSEVLARRPDVRAAMKRVVAADHRVAAAIADQYPALTLTAGTGFQAPDMGLLLRSWVWNLVAGVVAPIFDGGRRSAEVARTRAVVEDAVLAYSQVVLTALGEVEDALVQIARQAEHVALLEEQEGIARIAYEESEVRYLNGLSTYIEVLTALRALQQVEQTLLQARRLEVGLRVQLHRAVGGTWRE